MSAILPTGSSTATEASKKDILTHPILTAFIENSDAIWGKAMLTAAPIKGLMNEVRTIRNSSRFLLPASDLSVAGWLMP
jgi:hypothetical protein